MCKAKFIYCINHATLVSKLFSFSNSGFKSRAFDARSIVAAKVSENSKIFSGVKNLLFVCVCKFNLHGFFLPVCVNTMRSKKMNSKV